MLMNINQDIQDKNMLALYHEYTDLDQPAEFDALWDRLILMPAQCKDRQLNEERIMDRYYENFAKIKDSGTPNFMDVLSDVYFYNDSILREMSLIELLKDNSNNLDYLKSNIEELLDEAVTSWEEMLAYNYDMHNLDMYVYHVIVANHCVVSLDEADVPMEMLGLENYIPHVPDARGTVILAGHCMNILMVPFSVEMCATLYGETIYRSGDYQCQG